MILLLFIYSSTFHCHQQQVYVVQGDDVNQRISEQLWPSFETQIGQAGTFLSNANLGSPLVAFFCRTFPMLLPAAAATVMSTASHMLPRGLYCPLIDGLTTSRGEQRSVDVE